jgi:hypothetical protein
VKAVIGCYALNDGTSISGEIVCSFNNGLITWSISYTDYAEGNTALTRRSERSDSTCQRATEKCMNFSS